MGSASECAGTGMVTGQAKAMAIAKAKNSAKDRTGQDRAEARASDTFHRQHPQLIQR